MGGEDEAACVGVSRPAPRETGEAPAEIPVGEVCWRKGSESDGCDYEDGKDEDDYEKEEDNEEEEGVDKPLIVWKDDLDSDDEI